MFVFFFTFSHTRVIRLIRIRVCIITVNLTGEYFSANWTTAAHMMILSVYHKKNSVRKIGPNQQRKRKIQRAVYTRRYWVVHNAGGLVRWKRWSRQGVKIGIFCFYFVLNLNSLFLLPASNHITCKRKQDFFF